MEEIITSVTLCVVTLFPLLNPPGAIPLFCSLTINGSNEYRKTQARKTAINVFFILIVFLLIGKILLALFGISIAVLKIAGGLIVAHTAWEMVTGHQKLTQAGIGTGLHYPVPLPLQKVYAGLGYKCGDFPVTERLSQRCISLPIYPELTDQQIDHVVATLRTTG